jgi:hypothetical protein
LRQAIYGRLAGYEDVNNAERLARDPAMRAIVGREAWIGRQPTRAQYLRLPGHPTLFGAPTSRP